AGRSCRRARRPRRRGGEERAGAHDSPAACEAAHPLWKTLLSASSPQKTVGYASGRPGRPAAAGSASGSASPVVRLDVAAVAAEGAGGSALAVGGLDLFAGDAQQVDDGVQV